MLELCNVISKSGVPVYEICDRVFQATGHAYRPAPNTIYKWLNGQTRRPSNHSLNWVGWALGYSRRWAAN